MAAASEGVNPEKEEKNGDRVNSKNKQQIRGYRRSKGIDSSSSKKGKSERNEDGDIVKKKIRA